MAEMFNSSYHDPQKEKINSQLEHLKHAAQKKEKIYASQDKFEAFKDTIQKTVINMVRNKTAPWLIAHDGNRTLSYFPTNGYIPQGISQLWFKLRETQLQSDDPRWFSRKEIFDNGIRIKSGQKATVISFKSDEEIKHCFYWNASQLNVSKYEKNFAINKKSSDIYYPESLHPRDTLRADLSNWFNSLKNHTPYSPKGLNRTEQVSVFLNQAKSGTIFFIARDASQTSMKITQKTQQVVYQQKNMEFGL